MRARVVSFAAAIVLCFGGLATAGDDPAARLDDLGKRLTAPDPAAREGAEKELQVAPAEDLRALVRLLRDRMDAPVPTRDPFIGAEIPQAREKPKDAGKGTTFEVRILDLEPEVAVKWLGSSRGTRAVVAPVPAANVERLLRTREGGPRRIVGGGQMTAYDGADVSWMVVDPIEYVADFDIEISSSARIADPILGTVSDGMYLGLQGRRLERGGFHVSVDARGGFVEKPIPSIQVATEWGPVRVQVPTTTAFRTRTATEVPEGGSFLVGDLGPSRQAGGGVLVALVTVRSTDLEQK